jgi:hypothetical protein
MFGRRKSRPGRAAAAPERSEEEEAIPAGALIATRTGNVAHIKSGLPGEPGALCEALRQWTDWRAVSAGDGLKPCHRCRLACDRKAAS